MGSALEELEPGLLWKHFDHLRRIPRCSKQEDKAADYVVSVARRQGIECTRDKVGNVVVKKPATPGKENAPAVVLQSHLDMVCEKNKDVDHDFATDPIKVEVEGDYLRAKGTTLGADNGIGVCASIALMEEASAVHGPLELLFTVDEEEGMTGAYGLKWESLQGRLMINLDSEDAHAVNVGCAGGRNVRLYLPVSWESAQGAAFSVVLKGLRGGHSGVDIHLGRGNAIKLLGRLLWEAGNEVSFRLASISGGRKHNAIPREAEAVVVLSEEEVDAFQSHIRKRGSALREEYKTLDSGLKIEITPLILPEKAISLEDSKRVLDLIRALPDGVSRWSPDIEDLVETSDTVAIVNTEEEIFFLVSVRSSSESQLGSLANRIEAIARLAGAEAKPGGAYPGWQPNLDSKTLRAYRETHRELFGREPEVKAIHAGLETGIIGRKFPGMDMISIGPSVKNPHSPDEKVNILSVKEFYDLLLETLERLAKTAE